VRLLGIETATDLVGAAAGDGDGVLAVTWSLRRRRHAEALGPAVEQVLEASGLGLAAIEAVAVDVGPGLFTGLRVGVATAQGLAEGLGVGLVAATSLEVLAWAAGSSGHTGPVVPVVDARRGEVFAGRFDLRAGEPPAAVAEPALVTPGGLVAVLGEAVAGAGGAPVVVVGDGAVRYAEAVDGVAGVVRAGAALDHPSPAALVALAAGRLASGEAAVGPDEVRPRYLRQADARINWAQRRPAGVGTGTGHGR
jgi:tRNA threonylcarbamoyladenosine biosynthesis protein TsaB